MALKITKQIGTNRGITDSAYIRIVNYSINKNGYLNLNTQMFSSSEEASVDLDKVVAGMECFNYEIGNMFKIPLTKTLTRNVEKTVMVQEEYERSIPIMGEDGNFTGEFRKEMAMGDVPRQVEVEEEYQVPDMSIIENRDIFAFGYEKLKANLATLFGAENVIDC